MDGGWVKRPSVDPVEKSRTVFTLRASQVTTHPSHTQTNDVTYQEDGSTSGPWASTRDLHVLA